LLRGCQPGCDDVPHERAGEDEHELPHDEQREHGVGEHRTGEAPGAVLLPPAEETGKDRDEGRAERAAHHDEEEEVRDTEGGDVGVVVPAGAELPGDQDLAEQTEDAADDEGGGNDRRIGRHRAGRASFL